MYRVFKKRPFQGYYQDREKHCCNFVYFSDCLSHTIQFSNTLRTIRMFYANEYFHFNENGGYFVSENYLILVKLNHII